MDFNSWYNPSQAYTEKHVLRLTATGPALRHQMLRPLPSLFLHCKDREFNLRFDAFPERGKQCQDLILENLSKILKFRSSTQDCTVVFPMLLRPYTS